MKCPRRFCCQQLSVSSVQNGCSSPLLTIVMRSVGDAEADQVVADRVGAALAERQVVLGGAARVGVPFDHDLRGGPALQPLGVLLQHRSRVVAQLGRVEHEERVGERLLRVQLLERLPPEDLVLGRRRGRRRRRRGRWRRRRSGCRGRGRRRRGGSRRRVSARGFGFPPQARRRSRRLSGAAPHNSNLRIIKRFSPVSVGGFRVRDTDRSGRIGDRPAAYCPITMVSILPTCRWIDFSKPRRAPSATTSGSAASAGSSTRLLAEAVRGRPDPAILDCGCGTGHNLRLLRRYGRAYGIDLTWTGLAFARARGDRAVAQASAARSVRRRAFDLVTSFDVIYGLEDDGRAGRPAGDVSGAEARRTPVSTSPRCPC